MTTPGNDCPECDKRLRADGTCSCGWMPMSATVAPPRQLPAAYREVAERVRPDSSPDDPCGELGCTLRVRDHIEQAKRIASSEAWALRFGSQR